MFFVTGLKRAVTDRCITCGRDKVRFLNSYVCPVHRPMDYSRADERKARNVIEETLPQLAGLSDGEKRKRLTHQIEQDTNLGDERIAWLVIEALGESS